MNLNRIAAAAALLTLSATASAQQFILVPDSSADRIVKLNAFDGSLIDANFILDANDPLTYDFGTPKDVFQVDNQIWVIDQIEDAVYRFDQNGAWLGTTATTAATLDNCRGGAYANGVVYVSNDGSGNGAQADSVVMFDTNGVRIGAFSSSASGTSPFDVTEFNGELLVCNFTSVNETWRFDYAGNPLGLFHASGGVTGVDNPEQMSVSSTGSLLVAGFSAPAGVYEYDATGAQLNYFVTGGLRGVMELGNGLLLISDGSGIKTYDRSTAATVTILATTGGQFFGSCDFTGGGSPTIYCTAKTSSNGCVPAIGFTGSASPSGNFTATGTQIEALQLGVLFYGDTGPAANPFQGGFLCVNPPVTRMSNTSSGGAAVCSGTYNQALTSVINLYPAGTSLNAQFWFRDPGDVFGTGLSDGLQFTTLP